LISMTSLEIPSPGFHHKARVQFSGENIVKSCNQLDDCCTSTRGKGEVLSRTRGAKSYEKMQPIESVEKSQDSS